MTNVNVKGGWILVALAVLFLGAAPNAEANVFPSGDMENGGDATTPPLHWSSHGTEPGQGTVGVSTDTPTGTGQSLMASGWDVAGYDYWTYSHDYSNTGDYGGKEITVSYDYKGDVYLFMYDVAGGVHSIWDRVADWTHNEATFTASAGTTYFSFYLYDNSATGQPAYLDNLVVTPEPATMCLLGLGGLALIRRKR